MREGLWLVIGLLLVGVLVFRRTRQILAADFPGLRAVEGLAVILPLFLLVFAALYLALSQVTASSFSQELDHTRALYFAITVFARGLLDRLFTRAYLPGHPPDRLLASLPDDRRATLVARADDHGFVFDIRLQADDQGEGETVFLSHSGTQD